MRTLPREQLEELISYLAMTYPKAFFTPPQPKRPLKKNIISDLEKDRVLDDEKREAAVNFYMRDWNYERVLQVGAKRVDLGGREVGTVTELEQSEAEARVRAQKKIINERRQAEGPIEVTRRLHAAGKISTDMLSKITAPPLAPPIVKETHMAKAKPEANTADPFVTIQTLLDATRKALPEQPDLRRAFSIAGLRVISAECEKVAAELEDRRKEFRFSENEQPY